MRTLILALSTLPALAHAEAPVIEAARLDGSTVHVTLTHPDTGWDHYADGWEVTEADGTPVGLRELAHPHVNEQPFTRSLALETVPNGPLFVRARCNVDGWGEGQVEVSRD